MKQTTRGQRNAPSRGREFLLFIIATVIGIYSLGQGLQGVFFPGQDISLIWLAVAGAAMWILVAQTSRVKETWPSWPKKAEAEQTSKVE